MADSWLFVIGLGIASGCLVVMTGILLWMARDLHRTLHQMNQALPVCTRALRDSRDLLRQFRRIVARTERASRHVDAVIQQACAIASETLEQFTWLKNRARTLLSGQVGNGARSGPRRQPKG